MVTIAVDLGGTHLRVGAVSADGTVDFLEKFPSEAKEKNGQGLARIAAAVQRVAERLNRDEIRGLALGVPGIVDSKRGLVYHSPHFPDWKEVSVAAYFREKFGWPVVVENDCNMIARGEAWKGAAKGLQNFLMLTLGTGVGGALVWHRQLLGGDSGFAGEFGHITVETEGPQCNCGSQGCLEMYISATGILHWLEHGAGIDPHGRAKLLERIGGLEKATVAKLHEAALDGDLVANSAFKQMGYYLGVGVASLVNVTGIETVVVGGGVSKAWDFFIEPAKKELAERTYSETAKRVVLKRAELGDEAGLIGGAAAIQGTTGLPS